MGEAPGKLLDAANYAPIFDSCFEHCRHIVLAVSGGADSMAMMHLVTAWRTLRGTAVPSLSVVTVDHGLRPESAAEARFVAAAAGELGLPHSTLIWTGPKPASGIQAAARDARYGLISEHLAANRWQTVATAHTRDDQAETLLMRLARGSGVDGLAGMRESKLLGAMLIVRPMLAFSKDSLIATLKALGVSWVEDPSNDNADFERVRIRQLRSTFENAGLTNAQIALSAHRIGRARHALDVYAGDTVAARPDKFHFDSLGYARISWSFLTCLPEEIRLKILSRTIASIGASAEPVPLSRLEAMTEGAQWQRPIGRTLGGAVFSPGKEPDGIIITREYGRRPLPVMDLKPGQMVEWDQRYTVLVSSDLDVRLRVCALGAQGLSALKREGFARPQHPARALRTIPAFWEGERLAAVPLLDYSVPGLDLSKLWCRFTSWPFPS